MAQLLDRLWYGRHPLAPLLLPLGALFCALASARRACYRYGPCRVRRLPVPVVVVGNVTVGGTGKTPLVAWLVERLGRAGLRVGVVSRGYGGRARVWPQVVTAHSSAAQVGDEALLLARRTGCPLVVAPDRVAAARLLLERAALDVIVADDGLQHYRLGRDLEIAVVDGARRLGNGRCLPAGPLRERPGRLREVDFVVVNGAGGAGELSMRLRPGTPRAVARPDQGVSWERLRAGRVHAVAGIGHPQRFFAMLRRDGLDLIEHPFPDHHPYRAADLAFGDGLPVLMTEKDAVKCSFFAAPHHWYVPVEAELPASFEAALLQRLTRLIHA